MRQCEVIAIANQKGGVGKTTTAVNVATTMAAIRKQTLLIDLDPQGNATSGLGFSNTTQRDGVYDLLTDDKSIAEVISRTHIPYLDLITASMDLSAAEIELSTFESREYVFKKRLRSVLSQYDYIIIDCPPALGLLTINSLVAAHYVLIPLQCEYYALEGLSYLVKAIKRIRTRLNPSLDVIGVLLTMYDKRSALSRDIEEDVRRTLGEDVLETVIPRNVKVSEAPSHGKPVMLYDVTCSGAQAYIKATSELLKRLGEKNERLAECQKAVG